MDMLNNIQKKSNRSVASVSESQKEFDWFSNHGFAVKNINHEKDGVVRVDLVDANGTDVWVPISQVKFSNNVLFKDCPPSHGSVNTVP
jgi:hypothetical protein